MDAVELHGKHCSPFKLAQRLGIDHLAFGAGCIDRTNARMRISAAQNFAVKHSGNDQIADELRLARHFLHAIHSCYAVTDIFEFSFRHEISAVKFKFEPNKAVIPVQETTMEINHRLQKVLCSTACVSLCVGNLRILRL